MADCFRDFIEAEIETMSRDIDDESRKDPVRRTERLLAWIEKNAADFRGRWCEQRVEQHRQIVRAQRCCGRDS
jgi:hypothetical protein